MRRHDDVGAADRTAARALQAGDAPVVEDFDIGNRDQQVRLVELRPILVEHFRSEQQPAGGGVARTERPETVQDKGAVGPANGLSARPDDRGDGLVGVLAIDVLLRLAVHVAHQPAVRMIDAENPGRGVAAAGDGGDGVHVSAHGQLLASAGARLQHVEQAAGPEKVDQFVRHAPQVLGRRGEASKVADQTLGDLLDIGLSGTIVHADVQVFLPLPIGHSARSISRSIRVGPCDNAVIHSPTETQSHLPPPLRSVLRHGRFTRPSSGDPASGSSRDRRLNVFPQ